MKYLLPELHVQLNSPDEDVADAAEEAIERASEQARRHWKKIKPHMPSAVVRFCEEQLLHDADVFGPAQLSKVGSLLSDIDVLIVAQQVNTLHADHRNTLIFLHYAVMEEPRVEVPGPSDVFRRAQPHWLWDEFDLVGPGTFSHSILFSDGRVVTIRFRDFQYHLARIIAPDVFKTLGTVLPNKAASA